MGRLVRLSCQLRLQCDGDYALGSNRDPALYGDIGNNPFGLGAWTLPTGDGPARRENQVLTPSDMIALGDAACEWSNFSSRSGPPVGWYELSGALGMYQRADGPTLRLNQLRHGARWNIGFCDGHTENLRSKGLFDLSNPVIAQRWNSDHQSHNVGWVPPPAP